MALLRLPHPTSIFSVQNSLSKSNQITKNNLSVPPSLPSSVSRLTHSHPQFSSISVKPKCYRNFKLHFSATTQDAVVSSSSSSSSTSDAEKQGEGEEEKEEFSKTTLIAQNVPWTCTHEDIRSLFQKYGNVLDVELSMYSKTKNRGLAFITMGSPEEALEALNNLESYEYEGRVLKLAYAKAKKEKPPASAKPKPVTFNLFVANLSYDARDKHLKEFFELGGSKPVSAEIVFHTNPRRSSGYGFVSFKTKKEADEALLAFQGKNFMGRPIRVAKGRQFVKLQSEKALQPDNASSQEEAETDGSEEALQPDNVSSQAEAETDEQ